MNVLISKCPFDDKSGLAAAFVDHLLLFLTQRDSELAPIHNVAADSEGHWCVRVKAEGTICLKDWSESRCGEGSIRRRKKEKH